MTKMQIWEVAQNLDVDEIFFLHLWAEVLYCFRDAVYSCLYRGMEKKDVVRRIEEVDGYEYMKIAKDYFRELKRRGWLKTSEAKEFFYQYENEENPVTVSFMCGSYSPEDYYNWCVSKLPKQSLSVHIKKFIRKFV